jgi:hypothetical protein
MKKRPDKEKYVMYNGKVIDKSVLKPIKRSIMQSGQEQETYELDNEKIFNLMLEFTDYGGVQKMVAETQGQRHTFS